MPVTDALQALKEQSVEDGGDKHKPVLDVIWKEGATPACGASGSWER